MSRVLKASEGPLIEGFDLVMFDLDGVVYVGDGPVAHAAEAIAEVRGGNTSVAYITNNASRPPADVVDKLERVGVVATPDEVVTSAQAVAHLLVNDFGTGSRVAVLGGSGLKEALSAEGLQVCGVQEDDVVAMVSGYGPDVSWGDIMHAAVRIREGLPYYASNADRTIPTAFGVAPGHGVLVDLLRKFGEAEAKIAGKPARPLFDETLERIASHRPLMVGDRLDTDIQGAVQAEIPSLLVLTGVTGITELLTAGPGERPTYLAVDLRGLLDSHPHVEREGEAFRVRGWSAQVTQGRLVVTGRGAADDWWRAAAEAGWAHLDASGEPAAFDGSVPT
ncbi:MAG: HAD-IIA family hydrolase [Nocardioides sp.]